MKISATLFIAVILYLNVSAQESDSTKMANRYLPSGFKEHYTILKAKKGQKNGFAEVYNNKELIANGSYKDDKRFGRWRFYSVDTVTQIYNYTTEKIEYNLLDKQLSFNFDSVKDGDKVVYPIKIGGVGYGIIPFLKKFGSSFRSSPGEYDVSLVFTISSTGKLINYKIMLGNQLENLTMEQDIKKLNSEELQFIPGKVNDENVQSTLIYKSKILIKIM